VVDPGLAFGTGAHPTTRLCVELLLGLERGSTLDLGCGSGVLAVAAAKLGFAPVLAIDHDPRAVAATRKNATANGVELEARLLDVTKDRLPPAEVALANIELAVVAGLGATLESTRVVTSGYYEGERPKLDGFRPLERRTLAGWAADLYGRE
jgi:ribosomal protein L11 methyltransferase